MTAPATITSLQGTATPAAPASGSRLLYAKADGWYEENDAAAAKNLSLPATLWASDGDPAALTADAAGALTAAVGPFTLTTGNIVATHGDFVVTNTGHGVSFPAAATGSNADPNTLDDYEEGTWTTTISGMVNFTGTPTLTAGTYTKVGNVVHLRGTFAGTVTTANLLSYFNYTIPFVPAAIAIGAVLQYGGLRLGMLSVVSPTHYVWFPAASAIVAGADTFPFEITYLV